MRLLPLFTSAALASTTVAQNVTNCVTGDVCYAVNIPASTASQGSGDIYIHVTGPSSLSWIGIGQGSGMRGSNIFMIYANAAGDNVTVSPRLGLGEYQPMTSGATSQITLLEGSGIANGDMTANFKCSNCQTWTGGSMDFTTSSSDWIWAYKSGQAISSNDLSVALSQHSRYGTMNLNLQAATGGTSSNPFIAAASTTDSSSNNNSGSGSNTSGSTPGASSTGSDVSDEGDEGSDMILIAHAVIMGAAFAVLYPLGAIIIRLLSFRAVVWLHAGWMAVTYLLVLAGMGLGVKIANEDGELGTNHAIIGLVVTGSLILQPITGMLHHRMYKQKGGPTAVSPVHVWWGRAVVTLGIINGGLGLKLAGNTKNGEIVYGVVAGVMWVIWMAVVILKTVKKGRNDGGSVSNGSTEKMNGRSEMQ